MDNKHNIDQLFKGVLQNYELRPSSDVWSRINKDLDNTHKTPKQIPYLRYAAMLFIFASLCFFSVPVSHNHFDSAIALNVTGADMHSVDAVDELPESSSSNQLPAAESNATEVTLQGDRENIDPEAMKALAVIGSKPLLPSDTISDFILVHTDPETDEMAESMDDVIQRIYNADQEISAVGFNGFGEETAKDPKLGAVPGKSRKLNLDMSGFYLGVSGSYNQTSILEYNNQFRDERPIQPSLKFGTSKGITFGYNFNNKFGVQAEYIYNSIEGQNYVMTEDDQIVQKSLSLIYDEVPVTANLKVGRISDLTNKPVVLNYTAGMEYGHLKEYRLPQDKRYESTDNMLKENKVSLVLGLSYDIYLQDNLNISVGARSTISNNISLDDASITDFAKRNFVFGLKAGLNYTFK